MLNFSASRLLHNKHPRQVTTLATLSSLENAVNMVSGKEQQRSNRLGDSYSKYESRKILKGACEDFDAPVVALKEGVESLYSGGMLGASARHRRAVAVKRNITSFSYGADNVGRVRRNNESENYSPLSYLASGFSL